MITRRLWGVDLTNTITAHSWATLLRQPELAATAADRVAVAALHGFTVLLDDPLGHVLEPGWPGTPTTRYRSRNGFVEVTVTGTPGRPPYGRVITRQVMADGDRVELTLTDVDGRLGRSLVDAAWGFGLLLAARADTTTRLLTAV